MKLGNLAVLCVVAIGVSASRLDAGLIFSDDFNDGNASGWTQYDGNFSVVNGAYRIKSTSFANDARAIAPMRLLSDCSIHLRFNIANNPQHSEWPTTVIFRAEEIASGIDNGRYYQLNIGPNIVQFVKVDHSGGNAQGLIQKSFATTEAQWHTLDLDVIGNTATAYIDGVSVLSYNNFTEYTGGPIGLKSINSATTLFDDVSVRSVPEPSTIAMLLVAGSAGLLVMAWRKQALQATGAVSAPCEA
jgi:hypothetical protein